MDETNALVGSLSFALNFRQWLRNIGELNIKFRLWLFGVSYACIPSTNSNNTMKFAPFWQPLDEQISRTIHSQASPALDQAMIAFTSAGNRASLILAGAALTLILFWRYRRFNVAALYLAASLLSFALNGWLKRQFERPRPQLWQQVIPLPGDHSFPSGHAMISMTVYGLAAWFLAEHFPQWRKAILYTMGLLILLIGSSRVYLGVHWPSDVFVGFFCGFIINALSAVWHRRSFAAQINVAQNEQSS